MVCSAYGFINPRPVPIGAPHGINTSQPADDPQIGAVADERRRALVLRTPVALHVTFSERPAAGNAYPNSLMGVIAFVRQSFLDAQHYQLARKMQDGASVKGRASARPAYEPALEAMQPALAGLQSFQGSNHGLLFAGAVIAAIPPVLVAFMLQGRIRAGMFDAAVK